MWELDYKESWAPKNWCFWTVMLEKTPESSLDCKEIKPVNPKGNQSWIFIGGTDAEAEVSILWPPDMKNWFIGKEPDAGKDWRQEEKGTTEDEMIGWHHQLSGLSLSKLWELVMGGVLCCSPWNRKELDMTEQLNWIELNLILYSLDLVQKFLLFFFYKVYDFLSVISSVYCVFNIPLL